MACRCAPQGIPVCRASTIGTATLLIGNSEGFIVCWSADATDLYAHRLDWNGGLLWPTNGIPVCRAGGVQSVPRITGDFGFGAFIAWQDTRAGNNDVYALRVAPHLVVDAPVTRVDRFGMSLLSPNPARGPVRLSLALEREAAVSVDVLDAAGRLVATLVRGDRLGAGRHELTWSAHDAGGARWPNGVYLVRAKS